ncbi:MAG: methyltransferase domain-containing protein [Acidobacteria bacterium]|nr:MAG: methyltransferase domain-containing protein [Acidobacteriota bacterium]REK08740.1 MAG: methyltransferase domain-containing protein [Acidobacteriota bacterium]
MKRILRATKRAVRGLGARPDTYDQVWDRYVRRDFERIRRSKPHRETDLEPWRVLNTTDDEYRWPGDEWGDEASARTLMEECLRPLDQTLAADEVRELCELGSGAGRFTTLALERYGRARIHAFDVSTAFTTALRRRCRSHVESGRLCCHLLDSDPLFVMRTLEAADLERKVDALYSFDAMVHVDLHTLMVYWLTASRVLRPGGVVAMNVADACNEMGFLKLLHNAPGAYARRGSAGPHFMWISREIVETCLTRIGFVVDFHPGNGRDLSFSARLADPEAALPWLQRAGAGWLP